MGELVITFPRRGKGIDQGKLDNGNMLMNVDSQIYERMQMGEIMSWFYPLSLGKKHEVISGIKILKKKRSETSEMSETSET